MRSEVPQGQPLAELDMPAREGEPNVHSSIAPLRKPVPKAQPGDHETFSIFCVIPSRDKEMTG